MGQLGFDLDIEQETEQDQKICPNWNVMLLNDDVHTFDFVIDLLQKIFRKEMEEAFVHTLEIHENGQSIVKTCSKERAELYLEQVSGMREGEKGPLGCVMEPAE